MKLSVRSSAWPANAVHSGSAELFAMCRFMPATEHAGPVPIGPVRPEPVLPKEDFSHLLRWTALQGRR